jgi:CRP/FNR family transcriptional regulator
MAITSTYRAPSLAPRAPLRMIRGLESPCSDYTLYELSDGLEPDGLRQLDSVVRRSARFKKGETLYQTGDPFSVLYAIQLGSCKTTVLGEDGREQIIGYHMLGDIIGVDGIGTERHGCDAVALEESTVWALSFTRLERLARTNTVLQHNLHQLLARDIARDQFMLLLLGSMRAEERLAVFLLDLSARYRERGYSPTEFVLRLTREEIGSYLGIKLETVSRAFSRFQEEGLLQVQGRVVKLLNLPAVRWRAGCRH